MWTSILIILNVIVLIVGLYEVILKSKEGKTTTKTIMFMAAAIIIINGTAAIIERVVPSKTEKDLTEIKEEQRRQTEKLDMLLNPEPTYPGKVVIQERQDNLSRKSGEDTLINLLKDIINPMLHQPLRYDLEITYSQRVEKILNKKVMRVVSNYKWIYRNPNTEAMMFPQLIEIIMEPLLGVKAEDLFKVNKFTVDGQFRQFDLQMKLMEDGRYRFYGSYNLELKDQMYLQLEMEKIVPYEDKSYYMMWMRVPTKDIRLIYEHPSSFIPRCFVFGLGNGPTHEKQEPGIDIWNYEGWLLPKHGFMLYWQEKK